MKTRGRFGAQPQNSSTLNLFERIIKWGTVEEQIFNQNLAIKFDQVNFNNSFR